jgi:hypothetical protein
MVTGYESYCMIEEVAMENFDMDMMVYDTKMMCEKDGNENPK